MRTQHNEAKRVEQQQSINTSRRDFLKLGATATGAVAAGKTAEMYELSISQRADAIAPLAGALIITAGAGVVAIALNSGGEPEPPESVSTAVQDNVHSDVSGIVGQRVNDRKELNNVWLNEPTDRNPLADSAWTAAEVQVTRNIVNGDSQSVQGVTTEVFNQQLTRSYYNLIQKWNELWVGGEESTGLAVPYTLSLKESTGQLKNAYSGAGDKGSWGAVEPGAVPSNWEAVESTKVGSNPATYALYRKEWQNAPTSPATVPGIKEQLANGGKIWVYAPVASFFGGSFTIPVHPWSNYLSLDSAGTGTLSINNSTNFYVEDGSNFAYLNPDLKVTHPNFETLDAAPVKKWKNAFGRVDQTEVDLITGSSPQLVDYTATLDQKLAEGVIDPVDILGPREALNQFDQTDSLERSAAELAFSGVAVPGQFGYKATISHPDLAADELKGTLFIRSKPGVDISVNAGVTIPASDYSLAYLNFENRATGEPEQRVLGGDSPLEIVSVENVEGTQDVTGEVTDQSKSGITVWPASKEDVPVLLTDPEETGLVEVTADEQKYTTPVANVATDSGRYYVPSGTFSTTIDKSRISQIRLIPDVGYASTVSRVEPNAELNSDQIQRRVTGQQETIDAIRQAFREAQRGGSGGVFGGGGLFGGGNVLPTLPGLGVIESAIVVALGFAGLNALTS